MNQREKCYSNYIDDYQLNFTKFILTMESSTTCSDSNLDFQQPLLKILESQSFLLFDDQDNENLRISRIQDDLGASNARGPCDMAPL